MGHGILSFRFCCKYAINTESVLSEMVVLLIRIYSITIFTTLFITFEYRLNLNKFALNLLNVSNILKNLKSSRNVRANVRIVLI